MQDIKDEVAWQAQKPVYEQAIQQYQRALVSRLTNMAMFMLSTV